MNGHQDYVPTQQLPDFAAGLKLASKNHLYTIGLGSLVPLPSVETGVREALSRPIDSPPISELVNYGSRILILADDITRPTPQRQLIPPLLEVMEECGARPENITILIALGTHRPMTGGEIRKHFGATVAERVEIRNHEFNDPTMVVEYGVTDEGTPITINRRVPESDFVIGVSSIVPHAQVGWGGGCKIVLPGVSGAPTVEAMHRMAAGLSGYPYFAGRVNNPVRDLIEEVAQKAGLGFVLNVVFNANYEVSEIVAGHPVQAHRRGVMRAEPVFVRDIPEPADIVIANAHPAELEYWQGLKALTLAAMGLKNNGTIILVGEFPDGVSQSHEELELYGGLALEEFDAAVLRGEIQNGLCIGALYQHILVRERATVYCVSNGLSAQQKSNLGFLHFHDIQTALNAALLTHGEGSGVGIIDQGGEVIPRVP